MIDPLKKRKEILAIIPARGLSTRLPYKNVKLLNGKPLLAWTILAAQLSQYLCRIVVATDDDVVARIAQSYDTEAVINPSRLHTGDEQGTINVVNHTLAYLERYDDYLPLYVCILQPTSPLRSKEDIDNAIELLLESGTESAKSVCQGHENGAIYISRRQVFTEQHKVVSSSLTLYAMSTDRSVDIDTQEDFDIAEQIMKGERDNHHRGVLHKLDRLGNGKRDDKGGKGRRGRPRKVPTL